MVDANSNFRDKVIRDRAKFGVDHGAMAKKAAIDLAAKNKLNSDRLAETAKDVAGAKALARTLAEKNAFDKTEGLKSAKWLLDGAEKALIAENENYKTKKLIDQLDLRAALLRSKVVLQKHYPNGIPQDLINQLTALYSDVIKLPEEKDDWASFIKENNESIAHFTNVEALRVKNLIKDAQMSVVMIGSLFDVITKDMSELTVIGINPNNPKQQQFGKDIATDVYKELLKRHSSLQSEITRTQKEAGDLIGKFVAKTTGSISIENSALLNPFNELSELFRVYKLSTSNVTDTFFTKIEAAIKEARNRFNSINDNVGKQAIKGVENPIWGANSWYIITDSGNPANRPFYFNQKTGDTSWKMPNVISLNPKEEIIPTIPVVGPVYQKFLEKLPPFNSVEGLPPIIYTGTRDIADNAVVPDNAIPKGMTREDLGLANTEKDDHFKKVAELEKDIQNERIGVANKEDDVKGAQAITAISVIGSPQFLEIVSRLNTPVNGVIPAPNRDALNAMITSLSGDPYGEAIAENLRNIELQIEEFKKFKEDKDLLVDPTNKANAIKEQAIRVNEAIDFYKEKIQKNYNHIPSGKMESLQKQLKEIKPVAKINSAGTSTTATIASNDTPDSFSTDTDATPIASKFAMPSVSASTSSSATPTSASTESAPMQGASEEEGEADHSINEETGEKIHHPSWGNIFKINGASKSVASSASNGVADTASVDSAPIPLEADAAIAEANASTEVPTPLKSIPAPDPASAIKIQEDMDNEEEVTDDSTTDAIKKPTAPVTIKKQSSK
jgi:hypothetical protein